MFEYRSCNEKKGACQYDICIRSKRLGLKALRRLFTPLFVFNPQPNSSGVKATTSSILEAPVNITAKVTPGLLFFAFHWREAPANMLTNAALDPVAKIPEFKVSAIKVGPAAKK